MIELESNLEKIYEGFMNLARNPRRKALLEMRIPQHSTSGKNPHLQGRQNPS
jgi:hypothetical protein